MICPDCKRSLEPSDFYFNKRVNKYFVRCKNCHDSVSKKWQKSNPDKVRLAHLKRSFRNKTAVFSHYSKGEICCECCGEKHIEFLALDHKDGDGWKQRSELKISGNMFYAWIIKHNFPKGFRVLCHNCNQAIGNFGGCPHDSETIFTQFK